MTYVVILTVTSSYTCIACSGSDVSALGEYGCASLSCEVMDGRRSRPYSTGLLFGRNCICKIGNRN